MKISKTDKITPDHGPAAEPLGRFWKLVGPRLIEAPSLEIIQALIRTARPLSAPELAAQLELSLDPVCEKLTEMEKEGVLVREPSGSAAEPLYGLGGCEPRRSSPRPEG